MSQTQAQQQARTESWQNIGGATLMGGVSGAVAGIGGYGAGKLKTKISPEELKWYEGLGYTEKDVARTPKVMTQKEIAEQNLADNMLKIPEGKEDPLVRQRREEAEKANLQNQQNQGMPELTQGQDGGIINWDIESGKANADFYVAPNGKVLSGKYKNWIGTSMREPIITSVTDIKLKKTIGEVYRPGSIIGNGGTSDVIRFERETGLLLSKTGHMQKGIDMAKHFQKLMDAGDLSAKDLEIATQILDDLNQALGGK